MIKHYYIIHHFIWEMDLPLLGSGGMSFVGNKDSMEANEAQYHAHLWLELCLGQAFYSKMQTLHYQFGVVQMT